MLRTTKTKTSNVRATISLQAEILKKRREGKQAVNLACNLWSAFGLDQIMKSKFIFPDFRFSTTADDFSRLRGGLARACIFTSPFHLIRSQRRENLIKAAIIRPFRVQKYRVEADLETPRLLHCQVWCWNHVTVRVVVSNDTKTLWKLGTSTARLAPRISSQFRQVPL